MIFDDLPRKTEDFDDDCGNLAKKNAGILENRPCSKPLKYPVIFSGAFTNWLTGLGMQQIRPGKEVGRAELSTLWRPSL
jgi:hypothetical protein